MKTPPRILAFVLAGGEGARLRPLTAEQPKPAVPFADGYRIVDFVLSNLLNSGVTSVYVLAQYKPRRLVHHIDAVWRGRFACTGGFVRTLLPPVGGETGFRGTADAVHSNLGLVLDHRPTLVAVFAADHVCRMDVGQMASFHLRHRADVSVAAMRVPLPQAGSFGVITTDANHRIVGFEEKPAHPAALPGDSALAYVSMGNYLFEPSSLVRLLDRCDAEGGSDFGYHVMPMLTRGSRAFAYDFACQQLPGLQAWEDACYWRDVGTLQALTEAQRDVAGPTPRLDLACPGWPMHKERRARPRSRVAARSEPVGVAARLGPWAGDAQAQHH